MAKEDKPNLTMPAEAVTQEEIDEWYKISERMAKDKIREMELRKKIFGFFFVNPVEGVNDYPMTEGWVMKGTYNIDRKIIPEALTNYGEELKAAKLPMKDLVQMKPSLSVSAYKNLSDEQRLVFDKVLEIKPGTPSLKIVKPKRA